MYPSWPTQDEFEGISEALTGEPNSTEVYKHLIAVFTVAESGGRVAVVATRDAKKSWTLTIEDGGPYWVIRSIGETTLA